MRREKLTELVRGAAEAEGYAFFAGEVQNLNGAVREWPAAWFAPPLLRGKTERREGTITWRITLHLMDLTGGESRSAAIEESAMRITAALALASKVCSVSSVSCTPGRQSLTVHGETSTTLVCDVEMWYYI